MGLRPLASTTPLDPGLRLKVSYYGLTPAGFHHAQVEKPSSCVLKVVDPAHPNMMTQRHFLETSVARAAYQWLVKISGGYCRSFPPGKPDARREVNG